MPELHGIETSQDERQPIPRTTPPSPHEALPLSQPAPPPPGKVKTCSHALGLPSWFHQSLTFFSMPMATRHIALVLIHLEFNDCPNAFMQSLIWRRAWMIHYCKKFSFRISVRCCGVFYHTVNPEFVFSFIK